jgi:ATP-binding cassette subfamily C protein
MARENIGKEMVIIILASLFTALAAVIPSVVSSQIFGVIIPHTLRAMAIEVVLVLICFDIANVGFIVVVNVSISRVLTKIGLSLEGGIWDRLLGLKISFFGRYTTGELLRKIQGIGRLKGFFSINAVQTLIAAVFSSVNIIVLFTLETRITWYVLLMFLGLFTAYGLIAYKNFHYHRRYIETENRSAGFNHQALEGIERIKVSRAEERVFQGWSGYEAEKRYLQGRIRMLENLNEAVRMFFQFSSTAVVFFLISGVKNVEVGIFIAYVATFMMFHKGVQRLLKTLDILPEAAALIRSIDPIVKGEGEYNPEKIIPKDMTGILEVNHLTFRYGQFGRPVLRDISFRVEEGQSLGITGPSGCGKSTLIKALLGFYPLAGGKIFYGGYDLETLELRYLRRQLGVVLQHGTVPMGTIFDIITDNNPRIGEERVLGALEKADLVREVRALPAGLYTPLEQCAFSDAEYQRLMIARSLVQPRRFVIFDEPTRFQDNITQQRLLEHIYAMPATKVIVAQRLTTIRGCDSIVVLGQGTVIRQGAFPEVIADPCAL